MVYNIRDNNMDLIELPYQRPTKSNYDQDLLFEAKNNLCYCLSSDVGFHLWIFKDGINAQLLWCQMLFEEMNIPSGYVQAFDQDMFMLYIWCEQQEQ